MMYQYGVKDGYGIIHWARDEMEALAWMGYDHSTYQADPRLAGVQIVRRVNN